VQPSLDRPQPDSATGHRQPSWPPPGRPL